MALSPSIDFVEFFLKILYPTIIEKKIKIHGLQITGQCIYKLKRETNIFYRFHPGSYHYFSIIGKLPIPSR